MMGLTRQQARVLEFVRSYSKGNGYSPTLDEIAEYVGLVSRGSASRLLTALRERGHITWDKGHSRSLRITSEATQALRAASDAALLAECKRRGLR